MRGSDCPTEQQLAAFNLGDLPEVDLEVISAHLESCSACEALLDHLLHVDLTGFNPRKVPRTVGLMRQQIETLEGFERYWFDCLEERRYWYESRGDGRSGNVRVYHDEKPAEVDRGQLYADYVASATAAGERRRASPTAVGMALRKLVPGLLSGRAGPTVRRTYTLPSLSECRAAMAARLGQRVEDLFRNDGEDVKGPGDSPLRGRGGAKY